LEAESIKENGGNAESTPTLKIRWAWAETDRKKIRKKARIEAARIGLV
jgi:hypothetical protein